MQSQITAIKIPEKQTPLKKAFPYLVFLIVCLLLFQPVVSNDTFWLLNSGRYIIGHGFPATDPFTIHQGLHITIQQWLSTVIFWLVANSFGFNMLFMLSFIGYFLICFVIYRICLQISLHNRMISFMITIFAAIYLSLFIEIRPQIFSGLLFGLEIYLLELYLSQKKTGYLFLLPVLSLLLINLHAALWIFFFLLFIPYLLDGLNFRVFSLKTQRYKTFPLIIAFSVSLVAGFINPYGLKNMLYIFYAYFPNANLMKAVEELLPPYLDNFSGVIFYLYLLALGFIYIAFKRPTRLRYLLITFGVVCMSLSSRRSIFLFLVCAFPLLAYHLRDIHFSDTPNLWKKRIITASLILVIAALFLFSRHLPSIPSDIAPKEAVNFIYKHPELFKNYRLYNEFNTGGYLEFCGIRTFIDSREEVFLKSLNRKEDILLCYDHVTNGAMHYKDFIEKYRLTHFLVIKYGTLDVYLNIDPRYQKIYEDKLFAIYSRK